MNAGRRDPLEYFLLRPVKAARVSEISEATASSAVPPAERVNFHIGNPVQDERLVARFLHTALRDELTFRALDEPAVEEALREAGWEPEERPKLDFLVSLIRNSAPYMPRGGYLRNNPGELIQAFRSWLLNQTEPLSYDLGEKSGVRELILASGGVTETLRVLLHALSHYLLALPAHVLVYGYRLPDHLSHFRDFTFQTLPDDESAALARIQDTVGIADPSPAFLLLGSITSEETRRAIRHLCLKFPLFIVELNDAPNHLSLAREAGLLRHVLRLLTPGVLSPRLAHLSTVLLAGNPDIINIVEVTHFQLKGTPSAADAELLSYLLKTGTDHRAPQEIELPDPAAGAETLSPLPEWRNPLAPHAQEIARSLTGSLTERAERLRGSASRLTQLAGRIVGDTLPALMRHSPAYDAFGSTGYRELLDALVGNVDDPSWQDTLSASFLSAFLSHHLEYSYPHCSVVSGSSRTALSLLGFHCGLDEVIIPDLSWTYEHCFPRVTAVPLRPDYSLDPDLIIAKVEERIRRNPAWRETGAVALNNPHNATGQRFDDASVRRLLQWLLDGRITVIDDLAYQNVVPADALSGPPTLRQMADELVRNGFLASDQADHLITVHSVSKTDCLAGSRLAVVEIRREELLSRFRTVNATVRPNLGAIFLSYLFYRNSPDAVGSYWYLRNVIFDERMRALEEAASNLPDERNRYGISLRRPTGSMYPLMQIEHLPSGLSLEWLASGLARQGIGLLPMTTFSRTEEGFETARKTFRLTLGGTDTADRLLNKTRRVLIDLNRLIAEEEARYNLRHLPIATHGMPSGAELSQVRELWGRFADRLHGECGRRVREHLNFLSPLADPTALRKTFESTYLPERMDIMHRRFLDRSSLLLDKLREAGTDDGKRLIERLERELYKDNLTARREKFRRRTHDRTVHPTQMYSLKAELLWEKGIDAMVRGELPEERITRDLAVALVREFAGFDIAIPAGDEGDELLLDLKCLIAAEDFVNLHATERPSSFLSYWGDWDGSTRPSGQGHRLVADVVVENVARLAELLRALLRADRALRIDAELWRALEDLPRANERFRRLFDDITLLTHHLERRYRGVLPFHLAPGRLRKLGMRLHVAQDPLTSLWQHNDRLERRMLALRQSRKQELRRYFALNKQLRKTLHGFLPSIRASLGDLVLRQLAVSYHDLLQRIVITPRIHQKLITVHDPFAIDTTVHNIIEVNEVSGALGNPGMILGLQVSMATEPDALIALDRKMRTEREEALRRDAGADLPPIWLIPLFEDPDAVRGIGAYLGKIWDYARQTRRLDQEPRDRFEETLPEIFIAGSDLSQHVGQTSGAAMFREAKYSTVFWLAERGLVSRVRIKLGSGEPMQRQGGYYAPLSGHPAFIRSRDSERRFSAVLPASAKRSTRYATTPLMGAMAGGDLRTFQSNLCEHLRYLPVEEYARFLHHVRASQRSYDQELARAAEPFVETRLQFTSRGKQELERLTVGKRDRIFDEFLGIASDTFRQILYGKPEDVVGIHIISYFIARTTPVLRDRPTFRPGKGIAESRGQQILERIAQTVPLSGHGSLLRAIAHNLSQTSILGVNQLTTGLFRALNAFSEREFPEGNGALLLADYVLPNLPVYEMLQTLQIYHDPEMKYVRWMEKGFPAGNSAFTALREDIDLIPRYQGLFQKELVRRHGIDVTDFFEGEALVPDLLPTFRPDLAVLLQRDLFNTDPDRFLDGVTGRVDDAWFEEVRRHLSIPDQVRSWRGKAWEVIGEPLLARISSFVELALALSSLPRGNGTKEMTYPAGPLSLNRPSLSTLRDLGGAPDDSMQQFLAAAVEYLSGLSRQSIEVPTTVVKALKEAERIIKIEEQPLSPTEQDILRFSILQIARACGENG